jgi:hypothetical protein
MPSTLGIVSKRRPFSPGDLSGLSLWLDASDATTLTVSGSSVSAWADKSGNGYNVSQGTSAAQPTTGLETQNGLNVLSFDGTKGMRTANGDLNVPTLTAFVVCKSSSGGRVIYGLPHDATVHTTPFFRFLHFRILGGETLNQRLNGESASSASDAMPTTTVSLRLESASGDSYINGTRVINAAAVSLTYPNSVPFCVGENAAGAERIVGFFCEIVVFDRALTATETSDVESYLAAKWGL